MVRVYADVSCSFVSQCFPNAFAVSLVVFLLERAYQANLLILSFGLLDLGCVKDPSLESSSEELSAMYPCSCVSACRRSDSSCMMAPSSVLISDAWDCREAAVP